MGGFFLSFLGQFGYGDVLALLGRNFADFLNGLDKYIFLELHNIIFLLINCSHHSLHEYLKYSYPR